MKLENGFWVDANNNKWDCTTYFEGNAEQLSKTLLNCKNMTNCRSCKNCSDCRSCNECYFCNDCSHCSYCRGCYDCSYCSYCSSCNSCSQCNYCKFCCDCKECSNCRDCRSCGKCWNCSCCRDFQENPRRITGKKMGSRNDFPVVYWNEVGKEQCVVGCFRGTLFELEKKVKETHKNNSKHFDDYMKFIKGVRKYQELTEGE